MLMKLTPSIFGALLASGYPLFIKGTHFFPFHYKEKNRMLSSGVFSLQSTTSFKVLRHFLSSSKYFNRVL
jgi:hypothetical protein